MRIVLVNQFYPPDTAPTGEVLSDLAAELAAAGHTVTVLCSRASYSGLVPTLEQHAPDAIAVSRLLPGGHAESVAAKAVAYLAFHLSVAGSLLCARSRYELAFSLTTPPLIGLTVALAAKIRGCAHAHWVMDVYPDILVAHGVLKQGGLPFRFLDWLSRLQFRHSKCVITLGPGMAQRLESKTASPVHWVPLWGTAMECDSTAGRELRERRNWKDEDVVFMYSGNMGRGHYIAEFLQAARDCRSHASSGTMARARFVFAGTGKRRGDVEAYARRHAGVVELLPPVPRRHLHAHLRSADVLLASLETAWDGCMFPSKIQGIFSVGRPIIFVGRRDGAAAQCILDSHAGWVVTPGDTAGLLKAVAEALSGEERMRRGNAAMQYAVEHFSRDKNCERIRSLLEKATHR